MAPVLLFSAAFLLSLPALCMGGHHPQANHSAEYLLSLTSLPGGRPLQADPLFDCAWRMYAATYALEIQPSLTAKQQSQIHDALQLSSMCNHAFKAKEAMASSTLAILNTTGRPQIFVSPSGSDTNAGTMAAPLKSLGAAVTASRNTPPSPAAAPIIQLRKGTYFLEETVELTPRDSGLTITAYKGEEVELSGGVQLTELQWTATAANPRIFKATVDPQLLPQKMQALQIEGARATLARYPNANAELDLFPIGYVQNETVWVPPRWRGADCPDNEECGEAKDFNWVAPEDEWHGEYQAYKVGTGGACEVYDPPYSPWCSRSFYPERWTSMHYRRPSGFQPNNADGTLLPHAPYKDPVGAVVHTWRHGHWYSWMFKVDGYGADGNFTFGAGGNQGGEGSDVGQEWWVENVLEELDAENEYFYNETSGEVYLYFNGTGAPPAEVVVPTLANMIKVTGSQTAPVANVSLLGLRFTANRPTFMEPRGNPSGGDWALERMGAVLLEGAADLLIRGCTFTRLDSNAIFLSGFNQNVWIDRNIFSWLGQNAIASWGKAVYNDGTGGNFPRYTRVTSNFAYELGVIQKQSSMYFQAETAQATIEKNIVFNIPRAAINFNDGFGGGANMSQNLLFNTCRESSDHGAFNSWDRLPYLTTVRNGTASTIPANNNVYQNFIVSNYAADGGCLDNDDGSSHYDIHHNFCVYGGHKSDFDGNSKVSHHNLHVYPMVYTSACVNELQASVPAGYAEGYLHNICILPDKASSYIDINLNHPIHCDGSPKSLEFLAKGFLTGNNTVYVPGGSARVVCNHINFNATNWMSGYPSVAWKNKSAGYDNSSRVSGDMPSVATIISWAKQLLQ